MEPSDRGASEWLEIHRSAAGGTLRFIGDPGELKNLYSQQKNRAGQMKQWLSKAGALDVKADTCNFSGNGS